MLAAAGTLLSCQNDGKLLNEEYGNGVKFTATTECYDRSTRTSMNSNGNVVWSSGDKLSMFVGSSVNEQYKVADNSAGKITAEIIKVNSSSFYGGQTISDNVAYYPYDESISIEEVSGQYAISANFPAQQSYAANSFGNGAFPMVAVTDGISDKALKFYNLMGGLKLQLKGTCKVQTITLTGNANEILYGPATITAQSGAAPVTQMTGSVQKTVTLNCGGVQLNSSTATTFVIAVPAGALSSGFKVVITDTEGKVMEKSTASANTIVRSKLTTMPAFTVETVAVTPGTHEYVDLGLPSGNLWATCNVGAANPESYGTRFAWGETATKSSFSWSTYKGYKGSWTEKGPVDKDGFPIGDDIVHPAEYPNYGPEICGTENDAVLAAWGGFWHIPSDVDWQELLDNCTWTSTTKNSVSGYKITSNANSNWIFIPSTELWTSTLNSESTAKYLSGNGISSKDRYYGYRIRPVYNDKVSKIALDNDYVIIDKIGNSIQLTPSVCPANAVDKTLSYISSKPSVATVSNTGMAVAVSNGITNVTVSHGNVNVSSTIHVHDLSCMIPEYVDLGLSVKWATCNVGACCPEDYGDYFAWGEVTPKSDYNWSTYKYCKGSSSTQTKYCDNSSYGYDGFTDSKTVLDPEDDAASVNWGGSWRMSTIDELNELKNTANCTWQWYSSGNTEFNGIAGYKVTSKKIGYAGNYIFLPAAGFRYDTYLYFVGSDVFYWSSSLYTSYPYDAYYLGFYSGSVYWDDYNRYNGFSVRPVCH